MADNQFMKNMQQTILISDLVACSRLSNLGCLIYDFIQLINKHTHIYLKDYLKIVN